MDVGQGQAWGLTGTAGQAHAPRSSDVILAAAEGGLGAVQGDGRGHRSHSGACRGGGSSDTTWGGPPWAWPLHLRLPWSRRPRPNATAIGAGAYSSGHRRGSHTTYRNTSVHTGHGTPKDQGHTSLDTPGRHTHSGECVPATRPALGLTGLQTLPPHGYSPPCAHVFQGCWWSGAHTHTDRCSCKPHTFTHSCADMRGCARMSTHLWALCTCDIYRVTTSLPQKKVPRGWALLTPCTEVQPGAQ